jgi:hypothetical protein
MTLRLPAEELDERSREPEARPYHGLPIPLSTHHRLPEGEWLGSLVAPLPTRVARDRGVSLMFSMT